MPTLRQLEVFIEAARDCSFRVTADRLGISQPAISSQIKALERDLGYSLFNRRIGRNPVLTGQAIDLLPKAREVLEKSRAFVPASHRDRRPGTIRLVACIRTFLLDFKLKPLLPDFLSAHPEIDLVIRQSESTGELIDAFNSGECDVVVFRSLALPNVEGRIETIARSNVTLYANTAIADEIEAGRLALADAPFVMPRADTSAYRILVEALEANAMVPGEIVGSSQFPEILARWVIEGRGVSPLFDDHVVEEVAQGLVRPIGSPICRAETVMILRHHALRPEARPVLEFMREALG